ncbi:ferritin family protein [candidate division KSB1 bacterium]|nr:ferritin family protein [candidate division KSB1 bacterium]
MSIFFNADEIFEMAEQIERNGARFYRRAAEGAPDAQTRAVLLELADMEDEHEKVFAAMRAELSKQQWGSDVFDPDGQVSLYLKAMADGQVFDLKADPSKGLTGKESLEDIIRKAIGLEKDSIVFYMGIQEMVPEALGKDRINAIIKEEMSHITVLTEKLAAFKQ